MHADVETDPVEVAEERWPSVPADVLAAQLAKGLPEPRNDLEAWLHEQAVPVLRGRILALRSRRQERERAQRAAAADVTVPTDRATAMLPVTAPVVPMRATERFRTLVERVEAGESITGSKILAHVYGNGRALRDLTAKDVRAILEERRRHARLVDRETKFLATVLELLVQHPAGTTVGDVIPRDRIAQVSFRPEAPAIDQPC